MKNLNIFCVTNVPYDYLNNLDLKLAGVGKNKFPNNYYTCTKGKNIQRKERNYSELTFHYWFWKNKLTEINEETWIGFCAYRRFWASQKNITEINSIKDFLQNIPDDWSNYDVILGQNIFMDGWSKMRIIKHGLRSFILKPKFVTLLKLFFKIIIPALKLFVSMCY